MKASRVAPTESISAEESAEYSIVSHKTGEVYPAIVPRKSAGPRYNFIGGFCLMGMLNITKLRRIGLSSTGYDLAFLLIERAGYNNSCDLPFADLGKELSVTQSAISKQMAILERNRLIKRVGGRNSHLVMVNPSFAFRGPASDHGLALIKWAELHPLGLVPSAGQEQRSA